MAEAVRFELTDGFPSPVFKTGALNRSATLPQAADYITLPRRDAQARSNSAIDSTWAVCGNMLAMPAPRST